MNHMSGHRPSRLAVTNAIALSSATTCVDAAHRVLVAGMFPGGAAGAAGRDLTLRDGAKTPVQSVGGGALATPRPGN